VLNYVTQVTRLHRIEVYRIPDAGNGILSANLNPPAHDGRRRRAQRSLDAGAGLHLLEAADADGAALLHGHHRSDLRASQGRLFTIVYTVMKLVNPAAEVPFKDDELLESFRGIPAADLQEISKLIAKMSENQQQHLNLSKWLEMIEHSANRLGSC
jgi:hypothetical protein